MSLSHEETMLVMQYADGEAEDEAAAKALLAENSEARELLQSFEALGDGVRIAIPRRDVAIDVSDAVMTKVAPNDLDRARIRRSQRTRIAVVGGTLLALAAGVILYMRNTETAPNNPVATASVPAPAPTAVALQGKGVDVDSVDSEAHSVSVFYVTEGTPGGGQSVVVWIQDSEGN